MRVVFFGTPDVAVPTLAALIGSEHDVVAVVTQPDKPRGRGRAPSPSPVKTLALAHVLTVLQPASPKEEGFGDALRAHSPDVLAVVAYGHILPRDVLAVAPAVNAHFSLLPRYRGAAPVQRALMDGATETGVSVFLLEPTVDTGPVLQSERTEIGPDETTGDLLERLAPVGARLILRALDMLARGSAKPQAQDPSTASPAPKISPEETRIVWTTPAPTIVNLVRGLSPRPGAWTIFRDKRLTVLRARAAAEGGAPGTIVRAGKEGFLVAGGEGSVEVTELQPEGKRPMSGGEFVRGYRPAEGDRFE